MKSDARSCGKFVIADNLLRARILFIVPFKYSYLKYDFP